MDYPDYTTEHQKGKHLTYEDYVKIQVRLQDGWSANRIAVKELHCSPNTVRKIIRQGMTPLYHGKVQRFKAKTAWQIHKENRSRCCRTYKAEEKKAFLSYVESHFCGDDKWSLDACVGYALAHNLFKRSEMLCTKTLYNYVELGLLGIKNIDLPQKLHRRTKAKRIRERKRVLGRSIEQRPESVDSREEFGHWEIDEVIGRKSDKDKVLLTMVERKTRNLCVLRLADKSSRSLMEAFQRMEDELGQAFPKVFRSITADNGAENSMLAEIESVTGTPVYFTHPYTSCEKGTIENHNGLIRRFLPKGKRVDSYDEDTILGVELWANGLPRKILGYRTPDEAFAAEMDRIFAV